MTNIIEHIQETIFALDNKCQYKRAKQLESIYKDNIFNRGLIDDIFIVLCDKSLLTIIDEVEND